MTQDRIIEARSRPAEVLIDPMVLVSIRAEAGRCYPAEAIGLLAGTVHSGQMRVSEAVPLTNLADDPRMGVRVGRAECDRALAGLAARGKEAIGAYHSHPDGVAEPSTEDTAQGAGLEIVASATMLGSGVVRAWWLERGHPPVELEVP